MRSKEVQQSCGKNRVASQVLVVRIGAVEGVHEVIQQSEQQCFLLKHLQSTKDRRAEHEAKYNASTSALAPFRAAHPFESNQSWTNQHIEEIRIVYLRVSESSQSSRRQPRTLYPRNQELAG